MITAPWYRRWWMLLLGGLLAASIGLGMGALIWSGQPTRKITEAERIPVPPPRITMALTAGVWHCINDGRLRGLVVTSTTGGVHAAGSFHYVSMAADQAGSYADMIRLQRHLYKTHWKYLEVFGPSDYMNVKNGQPIHLAHNSALALQHDNHVHCAAR